eukprot:scaffold36.g5062.t1
MRARQVLLLLIAIACSRGSPVSVLDLGSAAGHEWSLDNVAGFGNVSSLPVPVPGYVQDALIGAGVIGNPLYRFGELQQQWATRDNWTFTLSFALPAEAAEADTATVQLQLAADGSAGAAADGSERAVTSAAPHAAPRRRQLLLCGVDGPAAVSLNGAALGRVENSHRPHAFDVGELLFLPGVSNALTVAFLSPVARSRAAAAGAPYPLPRTRQLGAVGAYNFVRKAASDYGWDWGPALVPIGLSGPVLLRSLSSAGLSAAPPALLPRALAPTLTLLRRVALPGLPGLSVRQTHLPNGSVVVTADVELEPGGAYSSGQEESGTIEVAISDAGGARRWAAHTSVVLGPGCWVGEGGGADASGGSAAGGAGGAGGGAPHAGGPACERAPPTTALRRSVEVLVSPPFQLWWPYEFGEQPLYTVTATFTPASGAAAGAAHDDEGGRSGSGAAASPGERSGSGAAAPASAERGGAPGGGGAGASGSSALSRHIGLRTVELVSQAAESPSGAGLETFYLRVNGLPLFARGANLVPPDPWPGPRTPARLRRLVAHAKAASHNVLRVWGGGRVLPREFYAACDEAGVLVRREVGYQAARLAGHPSVAIWGGNNEVEASFGWFPETAANLPLVGHEGRAPVWCMQASSMRRVRLRGGGGGCVRLLSLRPTFLLRACRIRAYAVDYSRLFVDAVRAAVEAADPGVPFVDGSPGNGLLARDPYAKRWGDVASPAAGDVHFYAYQSDGLDPGTYPPAKFVSEFGFMSWPSFVTTPEDWRLDAGMLAFRMRHARGQEEALIYEAAISHWRRSKADPGALTMGGPSWASLNADGSWRLLHHASAAFFLPVAVSATLDRGTGVLTAHLSNDLPVGVSGRLEVDAVPWAARAPGDVRRLHAGAAAAQPFSSAPAWSSRLDRLAGANLSAADYFVRLRFCPGAAQHAGYPSPFGGGGGGGGDGGPGAAVAAPALALGTGGGAPGAEGAASGDGGDCGEAGAPWNGARAHCGAALRLLRCSKAQLFPTELKAAALAPAEVEITSVRPLTGAGAENRDSRGSDGSGVDGGPGSGAGVQVTLSTSHVAPFVEVQAPLAGGRWSGGGVLLLPWEESTLVYWAGEEEGKEGASALEPGELAAALEANATVMWLQRALAVLEPGAAAAKAEAAAPPASGVCGGVRRRASLGKAVAVLVAAAAAALVL